MSANHEPGPPPRAAVAFELARALGGVLLLPWRAFDYSMRSDSLRGELRACLSSARPPADAPALPVLPERPLEIFVSCAEASGETHATSVVEAIHRNSRAAGSAVAVRGFGGARLAAAGVETLENPVDRSAMGFEGIARSVPYYVGLLERAAHQFRSRRPDLFLPVDSPALHVPLAHLARRYGVPVVHFVTPQYWGWAPWRVDGYRRAVDRALTILPFEPAWFAPRGVATAHVGHPLLDTLGSAPERPSESATQLALLPGSRAGVIDRNLPWMLRAAARFLERCPDTPIAVVQEEGRHADRVARMIEASGVAATIEVGDLHDSLARSRAALSVSGTILIDLLHHRLPTVVVYRLAGRREQWMYRHLLTTPWFASVNLLAGREVLPEFCFAGEGPVEEVGQALERCYNDEAWRARCEEGLDRAAERLGGPGAADRAARHALEVAVHGPAAPPSP